MVKIDLPIADSWFESEIRDGYYISRETKEIWAIELDMLDKVKQICTKHNLKWWVDGGTLLGTIRHGGFIPWDDDMDIFMPREDYDRFITYAAEELKDPYFLQTDWTDNVWFCHAKIRRSDTTALLEKDVPAKFHFNQGIFIDIFPFDNVPADKTQYSKFIEQLWLLKNEMLAARSRWWVHEKDNWTLLRHCKSLRDTYDGIRRKYNGDGVDGNSDWFANLGLPSLKKDIRKRKGECTNTLYKKFEMIEVPIPAGYHEILKRMYGDYMKPVVSKSNHGKILFDPQVSWLKTGMLGLPLNDEVLEETDRLSELYSQKFQPATSVDVPYTSYYTQCSRCCD
jgi:lipopolysaccharide cholinephosphotransferase